MFAFFKILGKIRKMWAQTASLSYFLLMFSTKTMWNWCATSRSYKNQSCIYSNTFLQV